MRKDPGPENPALGSAPQMGAQTPSHYDIAHEFFPGPKGHVFNVELKMEAVCRSRMIRDDFKNPLKIQLNSTTQVFDMVV